MSATIHEYGEYDIDGDIEVCISACGGFTAPEFELNPLEFTIGDTTVEITVNPFEPA